jgi:hypothetical protein
MSPAQPRPLPQGPLFFYRPQHNEHRFLEHYPRRGKFDAALIPARYLAPYSPRSKYATQLGLSGRELADSLLSSGTPFVVDPDTAVLVAVSMSALPTERIGTMPHAQVLNLPLSPMSFAIPANRRTFAQAAAGAPQAGAAALSAPYFQFERRGDRWHRLNLDLINDVRPLAQGRPLVTFIQTPLRSLVTGEIADAAASYGETGVERIFLRVAGFDPKQADVTTIAAYRRALGAFEDEGVEAIADCVGRFGLVVVGAGASGFSSGARFFQSVPEHLTYDPAEDIRSDPCLYEVPERWFAMKPADARNAAHLLPPCPVANCTALNSNARSEDQKEHLIHYFTDDVRRIAAHGAAWTRASLQQHAVGNTRAWISAV